MNLNEDIIKRAISGDREAFGSLYEEIYKDLYHYAFYMLKRQSDAEDAVSDTVTAAYSEMKNLRSPKAFKAWIFRILYVKCKNKRAEYMSEPGELDVDIAAANDTEMAVSDSYTEKLLSVLDETDRSIILMHVISGFKTREIARILDMNSATVRSRESRALKKLRQEEHHE